MFEAATAADQTWSVFKKVQNRVNTTNCALPNATVLYVLHICNVWSRNSGWPDLKCRKKSTRTMIYIKVRPPERHSSVCASNLQCLGALKPLTRLGVLRKKYTNDCIHQSAPSRATQYCMRVKSAVFEAAKAAEQTWSVIRNVHKRLYTSKCTLPNDIVL